MKKWKKWEEETNSLEYQFATGKKNHRVFLFLGWLKHACVSGVKLMRFFHCRSFAIPIHAPDIVREAAPGPLEHSRSQMDCEFNHAPELWIVSSCIAVAAGFVNLNILRCRWDSSGSSSRRWPRWITWACGMDSSMYWTSPPLQLLLRGDLLVL